MKKLLVTLVSALLLAGPVTLAANPAAVASFQDKKVKKTTTVTYNVNIHCKSCVNKLTDNLSFLRGVEDLKISLDDKTVSITYDAAKTDEAALVKAIEKCGYTAEKVVPADKEKSGE